jgi:hypothetical protein
MLDRFWGQGEPILGKGEELVMSNPLGGMKRGREEIRGVYERILGGGDRYIITGRWRMRSRWRHIRRRCGRESKIKNDRSEVPSTHIF